MLASKPIKTLKDGRLSYLVAIERSYKELGYPTKLIHERNILEVYSKGCIIPKTYEETIIEKWID